MFIHKAAGDQPAQKLYLFVLFGGSPPEKKTYINPRQTDINELSLRFCKEVLVSCSPLSMFRLRTLQPAAQKLMYWNCMTQFIGIIWHSLGAFHKSNLYKPPCKTKINVSNRALNKWLDIQQIKMKPCPRPSQSQQATFHHWADLPGTLPSHTAILIIISFGNLTTAFYVYIMNHLPQVQLYSDHRPKHLPREREASHLTLLFRQSLDLFFWCPHVKS